MIRPERTCEEGCRCNSERSLNIGQRYRTHLADQGEHVFTDGVRLLKVRMPGEDELVQPELVVLEDSLGDLFVAPDQRRPGPRANEANSGPEIRTHLEFAPGSTVEGEHPLLPDRLALA